MRKNRTVRFRLGATLALLGAVGLPQIAQAAATLPAPAPSLDDGHVAWETEFTRHVGALRETMWWDSADGRALGEVQRGRWSQPFRAHYAFYDAAGTLRAEGTQPWGLGVVVPGMAELQLLDGQENSLGLLRGSFMALRGGRFKIFNAHETHVADAWVDASGDQVIFAHPRGQLAQFATLERRPHGQQKVSRWRLVVQDDAIVAEAAWPIISAFFAKKLGATPPPEAMAAPAPTPRLRP